MIFSKHRRKIEPKRRFGSRDFKSKVKKAANYKRAFNPTSVFSLKIFPDNKLLRFVEIIGVIVLAVVIYFLVISSNFLITNITVKGNKQVSTQEIQQLIVSQANSRLFLIKKNNFFLMSQGQISKLLTTNIPTIKQITSYHRIWPNKIEVEISEHNPGFVIDSGGKYFLVDDEGVVVNEVTDSQKLVIIQDQIAENYERGELLSNQKFAPFVISMNKLWPTKMSLAVTDIKFPGKSSSEVQFVTSQGWTVLFDTSRPVAVQLADLNLLLSKGIKASDQSNLAYIDLRLNKWVYFCFKASPCQQQAQQPIEAGTTTTTNATQQ